MAQPDKEEIVREAVLRMVMWDEDPADIFHKMEVNGITGAAAQSIFREARAARAAAIRAEGRNRMGEGIVWMMAGESLYSIFWFGFNGLTGGIFRLVWLAVIFGAWKTGSGLMDIVLAHRKKGSLADDT